MAFAAFQKEKYLCLESFRKNGQGVKTPVWFAADSGAGKQCAHALYVYTIKNSGKAKRIRNNGSIKIAPCDIRGNVTGEWVPAQAEIITGEEAALAMKLLNKKYVPWKQLLDFFATFRKDERIVFAIHP